MIEPNFQMIDVDGATLRVVVEGEGPLVILLHGWPQSWYLWRHQIAPLVAAGYRVAVPDQRGYGGSSAPAAVEDYNILKLTADVDAIRAALGYDTFSLIGHDWGCVVAWNTALLYEKTCTAVMGLSVPFWRISEAAMNPPGMDDRFWYIRYFQEREPVDSELNADIERSLKILFYGLGGDSPFGAWMTQLEHPRGVGLLDALPAAPATLPPWMSAADLAYYVNEFGRHGFGPPVNWYRCIPMNDGLTAHIAEKRFSQPAAFAAGTADDVLLYDENWREPFVAGFEDLRFVELVPDAAHWLQVEKPAETTALMLRFLDEVR